MNLIAMTREMMMKKKSKKKSEVGTVPADGIWANMTLDERRALLKEAHARVNQKAVVTKPYQYVKAPECHSGNVKIFTDPVSGLVVYGAGSSRGAKWYSNMLVMDLAERFKNPIVVEGVEMPRVARLGSSPRLAIDWPDFGIPALSKEDWKVIVEELREARKEERIPEEMLVCCVGGHGRTGTCLAILASLMGACEGDPVKFVRKKYCKNCVESNGQLDYIEEVCEVEVKEGPAKSHGAVATAGVVVDAGVWEKYDDYGYGGYGTFRGGVVVEGGGVRDIETAVG